MIVLPLIEFFFSGAGYVTFIFLLMFVFSMLFLLIKR